MSLDATTEELDTGEAPPSSAAPVAKPNGAGEVGDLLIDDAGDGADERVESASAPSWREDWREALAGSDEKYLTRLKRYASFENYAKAQRSLEQKVSSGEFKREVPFPADGSDEDKASWLRDRGLPEKPDGYELPQIKDFEFTEADQPIVNSFLERLHNAHAPQSVVNESLNFYADLVRQTREAQAEASRAFRTEAEDALRAELGNDYRPHMMLYKRVLEDAEVFPGEAAQWVTQATVNGQRLINHPDFARAMIAIGMDKYGAGGLITSNEASRMASRKDEILKVLNSDPNRYFKEGLDKEFSEILIQEERSKPRR